MPPPDVKPRKKELWFPCGRYFLRTIKREDASDRWAGWLADPWTTHALNSAPAKLTKSDIVSLHLRSPNGPRACWTGPPSPG